MRWRTAAPAGAGPPPLSKHRETTPKYRGPQPRGRFGEFWPNEAGPSAAGAAIDHLINPPPAYNEAVAAAHTGGMEILEFLERRIVSRVQNPGEAALFARDIHVLPEFLANR